jgi:chromosome segregation ATPase
MNSEELDRLNTRIEQVHALLQERELKLQDFATSMTVRSLRYHLQDLEQQRDELEAELEGIPAHRHMSTKSVS